MPLYNPHQPLDADLTTIAGLTATTDNFMQAKSSAWASRTVAQVRTDLHILSDSVNNNAALGPTALDSLTTGADNTAVGAAAQTAVTEGIGNTAVGKDALRDLTTGDNNTAVGLSAQRSLTAGNGCSAFGVAAQRDLTSGAGNVAFGIDCQLVLTTGSDNTAIGASAQIGLTSGNGNLALGVNAQRSLTTGSDNVGLGVSAMRSITDGFINTAVGMNAGYTDGTTATGASVSNTLLLGYGAQATVSNVAVIGSTTDRMSLCLGNYGAELGSGRGVFALSNAQTNPSTNPSGGGVLYADAGALKWRGSSGTVTTIAVA